MGEPYRTLLGHFRHEVGHYYWDRLVRGGVWLEAFRGAVRRRAPGLRRGLQAHHAEGPPPDWQEHFVSAYATAHPWEDFAETWAHYLHIVDTLETAARFRPARPAEGRGRSALAMRDRLRPLSSGRLRCACSQAWLPLTFAVNSLNQSMGQPDLYPFVLAPTVMGKLRFVHGLLGRA